MQQIERKDYRQRVPNTGDALGWGGPKNLMKSLFPQTMFTRGFAPPPRHSIPQLWNPAALRKTLCQRCMKGRARVFLFFGGHQCGILPCQCLKPSFVIFIFLAFAWRVYWPHCLLPWKNCEPPPGKDNATLITGSHFTVPELMGSVNLCPNAWCK